VLTNCVVLGIFWHTSWNMANVIYSRGALEMGSNKLRDRVVYALKESAGVERASHTFSKYMATCCDALFLMQTISDIVVVMASANNSMELSSGTSISMNH
jgi:hypothetical protein